MRQKIQTVIALLAGTSQICFNCKYFHPELGHGAQPMWNGPCTRTVIKKYTEESKTCSHFDFRE